MSEDATDKDAQAMDWLVNKWGEEVIGQVRESSLAGPGMFQSHRRAVGGRVPVLAANQLAFATVNVLLTMVEGAAGLARRHFAEVLGVAVPPRQPTAPTTPPTQVTPRLTTHRFPAPTAPSRPAPAVQVSEVPLRLAIRAGESHATCSFVVENTTGRPLHTVRFTMSYLTAGPDKAIPPGHASFEPALFELGPHESAVVTVRIRTEQTRAGRYLGMAECGRFRQVISLEVT